MGKKTMKNEYKEKKREPRRKNQRRHEKEKKRKKQQSKNRKKARSIAGADFCAPMVVFCLSLKLLFQLLAWWCFSLSCFCLSSLGRSEEERKKGYTQKSVWERNKKLVCCCCCWGGVVLCWQKEGNSQMPMLINKRSSICRYFCRCREKDFVYAPVHFFRVGRIWRCSSFCRVWRDSVGWSSGPGRGRLRRRLSLFWLMSRRRACSICRPVPWPALVRLCVRSPCRICYPPAQLVPIKLNTK